MRFVKRKGRKPTTVSENVNVAKKKVVRLPKEVQGMADLAVSVLSALVLAIILNTFFIGVTEVSQRSMQNTLIQGDRLLVLKLWKQLGTVETGQVVIFQLQGQPIPFVKRVIGLPGDVIDVKAGKVVRNGKPLDESYTTGPTLVGSVGLPYTVPASSYFLMGDNRGQSNDSRNFGAVPKDDFIGVALFRFWPVTRMHGSFFTPIP